MKEARFRNFRVVCVSDEAYVSADEEGPFRPARAGERLTVLTVGREYEVVGEEPGMYAIIDDTGGRHLFPRDRFRIVKARARWRRGVRESEPGVLAYVLTYGPSLTIWVVFLYLAARKHDLGVERSMALATRVVFEPVARMGDDALSTVIVGSTLALMLVAPLKRKTWACVLSGVATFVWGFFGFFFVVLSALDR